MELTTAITPATPARTIKEATGAVMLNTGEHLKVEIGTEQELDVICPSGKTWLATVHVHVVETDAP